MAPLPDSNEGARIAFYVVFGAFLLLEWRIRLRSQFNPSGTRVERGSLRLVYVTIAGGLIGAFLLATRVHAAAIPSGRWVLFGVGLALMVAGIALRQWAIAVLGRFFTVNVRIHPDQQVVDRGPYRWVRHPSYTGLMATLLGIGLALGNWAALVLIVVLPTIGLVARIRVEERALLAGLGEPYRRFAATRAHLVPGIW